MRAFLETPDGQIHYRVDGVGEPPLLLLHPIPRSMDVFADVIPIFSQRRRVIAIAYKRIKSFSFGGDASK